MRPSDLDDVPELFRLRFERGVQFLQRRIEAMLELFRRADVNRGRDHVIARLTHVDVIVRVDRIFRADRFAGELAGAVRDYFIRVRVRARAGTGLENVEREMLVQFAFYDFFRRLNDERAPMGIEQPQIGVRLRGGPFYQAQGANEGSRKAIPANRKIKDRPLGGSAVERGFRDGHFAHRILFGTGRPGRHAEWFVENSAACLRGRRWPFRRCTLWKTVMNIGGIFWRKYSDSARSKSVACWRSSFVTW